MQMNNQIAPNTFLDLYCKACCTKRSNKFSFVLLCTACNNALRLAS